jgi:hypothetical protein
MVRVAAWYICMHHPIDVSMNTTVTGINTNCRLQVFVGPHARTVAGESGSAIRRITNVACTRSPFMSAYMHDNSIETETVCASTLGSLPV